MQLIYLAAGRGKRLGQKYSSKPKCFVKINNKKIIDYNKNFFSKFNKVILITGYKSEEIEKKFQKNKKIFIIYNKDYMKTNMVYSMFLARDYIKEDVVVCYGDIIFNSDNITRKLFRSKKTIMPLNTSWYNYWLQRMNKKKIIADAENVIVKKNHIISIGSKIYKKFLNFNLWE